MRQALLALALTGCNATTVPFSFTFDATDISRVVVEADAGSITVRANPDLDEVHVSGVSIQREFAGIGGAENDVSASASGDAVYVTAANSTGGEVDLYIEGPIALSAEITATSSAVVLDGVWGDHIVDALTMDGTDLRGALVADVATGLDIQLQADDPSTSVIRSASGVVTLALPYGGSYLLQVDVPEENGSYTITDLGFDQWDEYATSFTGTTGGGTVEIAVEITTGSFTLEELDLTAESTTESTGS